MSVVGLTLPILRAGYDSSAAKDVAGGATEEPTALHPAEASMSDGNLRHGRAGKGRAEGVYHTRSATSETSSSLRCWASSPTRFAPMDTEANPHWVDSARRSRST